MMETFTYMNILLSILVPLLRDVTSLLPQTGVISLSLLTPYSHGILIHWSGLNVSHVDMCELSYQTEPKPEWTILLIHAPINSTVELGQLQSNTSYQFRMTCQKKLSREKYTSRPLSFTTLPADDPPRDDTSKFDTTPTSVTKTKLKTRMGSHITVLGVLFGLAGVGIVLATTYYACSKYRRRRRVQRFLQFRSRTDSFPNLAQIEEQDDMDE